MKGRRARFGNKKRLTRRLGALTAGGVLSITINVNPPFLLGWRLIGGASHAKRERMHKLIILVAGVAGRGGLTAAPQAAGTHTAPRAGTQPRAARDCRVTPNKTDSQSVE